MNRENAKDYLPLVQALAEGKTIQFKRPTDDEWDDIRDPEVTYNSDHYRIKPAWVPQFKVGERVRIIEAELGARGADNQVGTVTDEASNHGLSSSDAGYHVKLENGTVWAIGTKAKLELVPWSLSRHIPGFRELAEGEEWHRQDFTEDMLPEGWRPLLKGEPIHLGDELRGHTGEWCVRDDTEGHPACDECPHRRARRPLPLLPEPVRMVPLEPSDVPPGSFLRKEHWAWSAIQCNNGSEVGVVLPFMGSSITWLSMCTLKDEGWQILRPGSPEWQPCTKEARS